MSKGLPSELLNDLRAGLLQCLPYEDGIIEQIFVAHGLNIHIDIPTFEGKNRQESIESIISTMFKREIDGVNVLSFFLLALKEEYESVDDCYSKVEELASRLNRYIGERPTDDKEENTPQPKSYALEDLLVTFIFGETGWKMAVMNNSAHSLNHVKLSFIGSEFVQIVKPKVRLGNLGPRDTVPDLPLHINLHSDETIERFELTIKAAYLLNSNRKPTRVERKISLMK